MAPREAALALCLLSACSSPGAEGDDAPIDAVGNWQGPVNPGFEAEGTSPQDPDYWGITSQYLGGDCPSFGGGPSPVRVTGTSFMPTDGTYYLEMPPEAAMTMSIEQDGVYLDEATELVFDYSISQPPATAYGDVTIEWLFTSQGTTTLWQRQFPQGTGVTTTEQRDEVVTFTSFPEPGRLMLRLTLNCSSLQSPPGGPAVVFAVDNIRVN